MNLRVACLVVFAVGCAPQPVDEEVTAREDELKAPQAGVFRALFVSELHAARARCLLDKVGVGALTQQGNRFAGSTLEFSTQGQVWRTRGCGPSTTTHGEPNANETSLLDELTAARDDGRGLAQYADGLFRQSGGDAPSLEFSSAEGRELGFELAFDDFERAQVTVAVTRLALGDAARELANVRPEVVATLPPAQRHVAWVQLSRVARMTGELAALADATSALVVAGPGQYVRAPGRTCSALLLQYRCVDFTWQQ